MAEARRFAKGKGGATVLSSFPLMIASRAIPVASGGKAGRLERRAGELLEIAGIEIGGPSPWDIRLNSPGVLGRIAAGGTLALGESYEDGEWEVDRLDVFFERLLRAGLEREASSPWMSGLMIRGRIFNRQSVRRAWQVGAAHYDLGSDFYQKMLGPCMTYSCGYWKNAASLAAAQEAKLDLVCRKLRLEPGMRLLDIGCGWGGLLVHAAVHYGVSGVGVTVSKDQADFAKRRHSGLPVEIRLQDYRTLDERFDRVASVGMYEHVGKRNYRTFMQVAHRCLADDGLFLLQTIGKNERGGTTDPWIDKYIFPNGEIPAIGHIADAADNIFVTEDFHSFGVDYDKTLMAWHSNFEAGWPAFSHTLGERFHRRWRYYLLSCAGAFRARNLQLWQWVFSKSGLSDGCPRIH